jgi:hypothetical protein
LRRSVSLGTDQVAAKLPPAATTEQEAAPAPALARSNSVAQRPGLQPPGGRQHQAHPEQHQHGVAPRTLAEVLGPGLVLLDSPAAAADATVQLAGGELPFGSRPNALDRRHSSGLLGALSFSKQQVEPACDADSTWTSGGAIGQQLPAAAVSRCRRMRHEGCIHMPDLDDKMEARLERRATTRVRRGVRGSVGAAARPAWGVWVGLCPNPKRCG